MHFGLALRLTHYIISLVVECAFEHYLYRKQVHHVEHPFLVDAFEYLLLAPRDYPGYLPFSIHTRRKVVRILVSLP